jgi:hypothetical protein
MLVLGLSYRHRLQHVLSKLKLGLAVSPVGSHGPCIGPEDLLRRSQT